MIVVAFLGLGLAAAFRYRPLITWTVAFWQKVPVARRYPGFIKGFYESAYGLFAPRALIIPVTMGFVSWAGEGVALYLVFRGLGAENSWELVVQAVFILSVATLAGAVLLLPGGLGAAEGGITGLAQSLVDLSREAAAASALIIRISTLWFGVAVGLIALMVLSRRRERKEIEEPELAAGG